MNLKMDYKFKLRIVVIISILLVAMVYAISDHHMILGYNNEPPVRPWNIIDPQSEYGIELISIAEKAIEKEGIDTNYIAIQNIAQIYPDNIRLRSQGANIFSSAVIYSYGDLADEGTIKFFEPDLDIYNVYNYHLGIYGNHLPENRGKYSKNVASIPQTSGWGKDYNYRINGDSIELTDPVTNNIIFILSDHKIVQDESRTGTITEKVNSEYAFARQLLPIDKEKPYMVIDITGETKENWSTMDVYFHEGQLYSLYIEEGTRDIYNVAISHTVIYYDEEGNPIGEDL
ncbi:hypothetical protein [Methanolobus profundi]|uniref:Uncharacterized protein n=1 Tax=Methanolobus profundi TaxID=487685 RepID=A0A1I4RYJ2_9EURY|nr:hypothetical protein [Methanolobus profundi]SFM57241.1 hypothetical protein SAMN04488696_1657 [Methanolobus profundi]